MTLDEKNLPVKEFKLNFTFDRMMIQSIFATYPNTAEQIRESVKIPPEELETRYYDLRHFFDKIGIHVSIDIVHVGRKNKFNYTICAYNYSNLQGNYSGEIYDSRTEAEYMGIMAAFELAEFSG